MASQIPILFVRGTHYEVGYEVGRQFKDMITNLLSSWKLFNEVILPKYATEQGLAVYELSLRLCRQKFPQYVKELEGIAAGSGVPFDKIFLLHIDSLLAPLNATPTLTPPRDTRTDEIGCTSVMNPDPSQPLLGHTEDAPREFLNHIYIVDVEIVDENQERLEKFCSLAYAGHLPGYTMGYNSSGLIYSINTLYPAQIVPGKTPRNFLTRALLAAKTVEEMLTILRDIGTGTSDGFGINLIACKRDRDGDDVKVEGGRKSDFYNIEVAPPKLKGQPGSGSESEVNVLKIQTAGSAKIQLYAHCNKYLRISIPEISTARDGSSAHRHAAIHSMLELNVTTEETEAGPPDASALALIKGILSDTSDPKFPIYRSGAKPDECATLAVGVFDVRNKKWSIYVGQPDRSSPALILPLNI